MKSAAGLSARAALRACQATAPQTSPSITTDEPGRLAAVISVAGAAPRILHQYLVSHPQSSSVVELAMWASSPPAENWPVIPDATVLEMAALMIVRQLTEGVIIHAMQDIAELVAVGGARGEAGPINLPQCSDQGVTVLAADLAVFVTMTLMKARLLHDTLHVSSKKRG